MSATTAFPTATSVIMNEKNNATDATDAKTPHTDADYKTQITVFSGFLGSGKTTVITSLLQQMNSSYRIVWLKNEYGDVAVDSRLMNQSSLISTVELLNGCICCTSVGKLSSCIEEIVHKFHPHRIIIETSGSAFPAPIAWEIARLQQGTEAANNNNDNNNNNNKSDQAVATASQTSEQSDTQSAAKVLLPIELDGIVCVIDAQNFEGYADKSYTAKVQAKYTDLILINKKELATSDQLDRVLDELYELNPETPKLYTSTNGFIDYSLIFNLDSKLLQSLQDTTPENTSGIPKTNLQAILQDQLNKKHAVNEDIGVLDVQISPALPFDLTDLLQVDGQTQTHTSSTTISSTNSTTAPTLPTSFQLLSGWKALLTQDVLPRDSIYRVKGLIRVWPPALSLPRPDSNNQTHKVAQEIIHASEPHEHKADGSCCHHQEKQDTEVAAAPSASAESAAASSTTVAGTYLLNWAFGRAQIVPLLNEEYHGPTHISVMCHASSLAMAQNEVEKHLHLKDIPKKENFAPDDHYYKFKRI